MPTDKEEKKVQKQEGATKKRKQDRAKIPIIVTNKNVDNHTSALQVWNIKKGQLIGSI